MNNKTIAYLYRWTELSTGKWYEGSRTAKGCSPDDGYICSSKSVKPMILENPINWIKQILVIGEPKFIRELETKRLRQLDAKNNPMSYNKCNAHIDPGNKLGRKESSETRKRKSIARQGDKNPMYGKTGEKCPHFGKKLSQDWRDNISAAVKNYNSNRPKTHNQNISKSLRGNPKVGLKGDRNPRFKGYYISPTGERFDSSRKAAVFAGGRDKSTLVSWAKNNKNGWSFEPI